MSEFCFVSSRFEESITSVDPPQATTSTVIIDRCPLFREGLRQVLSGSAFTIVASDADLKDVSLAEDSSNAPLLIILASSSDFADDLANVKSARVRFPNSAMVSLCRDCPPQQAAMLLMAGVAAILPVPERSEGLVEVLELVMLGQRVVPLQLMGCCVGLGETEEADELPSNPWQADVDRLSAKLSRLSTREVEIVQCLLAGEPNRSIAQRLMISEATVKVHVKAILRKIKVKNRTQAAIWALNNMDTANTPSAPLTTNQAIDRLSASPLMQIALSAIPVMQIA